ncbi:MAG: hypothetical protein UU24_C0020G0003 [Candidatus Nomurabacteria bacterium GW2011_GWA2_40_9]|uniref:tRNA threonylcarbamoyladenosine biosynthesis protein TsaE n=1 Tax=Candidatus Nomurabacteria bacterium GW2011_GWA2_40_9 TaxID=1618734 RepID=A0A0G0WU94_9BACT|nr:MAG: hypothetical protein UU24_C0020G0003 [Candidatus Nomurabacteria bacterium GW2011_GWA2_40_9]
MNHISKSSEDTEKIAKEFLDKITNGFPLTRGTKGVVSRACVVGLTGDLGTGKTTFTQFVAKSLGVKTKVNSPTFVIMKRYSLPLRRGSARRARGFKKVGRKFKNLFHIDAYRLKNEKELFHLGWEEIISNPENLVFIEWPELVAKAMPKKHYKISIKHLPRRSGAKAGTKEGHRKFGIKFSS